MLAYINSACIIGLSIGLVVTNLSVQRLSKTVRDYFTRR